MPGLYELTKSVSDDRMVMKIEPGLLIDFMQNRLNFNVNQFVFNLKFLMNFSKQDEPFNNLSPILWKHAFGIRICR